MIKSSQIGLSEFEFDQIRLSAFRYAWVDLNMIKLN